MLLMKLVKRDILGRYRGSALGVLWSFFMPLLLLAIFTFVFSGILKAKWASGQESHIEFAIILFVGVLVHGFFAECLNRSPALILSMPNLVKKVRFPLELMPISVVGTGLFHALVGFIALLAFYLVVHGKLQPTIVYMPLVLVPLVLWTLASCWFFAALGVYLRDLHYLTGFFITAALFLSPVFYPMTAIPAEYRGYFYANPLTTIIEQMRDVVIWGNAPDFAAIVVSTISSAVAAWLGLMWFRRAQRGFADVV